MFIETSLFPQPARTSQAGKQIIEQLRQMACTVRIAKRNIAQGAVTNFACLSHSLIIEWRSRSSMTEILRPLFEVNMCSISVPQFPLLQSRTWSMRLTDQNRSIRFGMLLRPKARKH